MKHLAFAFFVMALVACGENPETTQTELPTTVPETPAGTVDGSISVSDIEDDEANGALTLTSLTEIPNGETTLLTIIGTNGIFQHKFEINYSAVADPVLGIIGHVEEIKHVWGEDLTFPEGIALCREELDILTEDEDGDPIVIQADCNNVAIYPDTGTFLFYDQVLEGTPMVSKISGAFSF